MNKCSIDRRGGSPSCGFSLAPLDFERIGCRFSLLNLDGDDYKLTPEHASEAEVLEDLTTTDELLFWPFKWKTDWNSEETWNYFSMSPRKGICITASGTPPDSIPSKHHDRNMDVEDVGFFSSP
ncbi:hypothetical protein ACFX10_031718 [Malus domestica]